jgi:predicted DCC family thiol-disulfide oxidoreductase YuxK
MDGEDRLSPMASDESRDRSGSPPACALTVYYDGACPLCRREVALYQRSSGADSIDWRDVSKMEASLGDLDRTQAMARFHVRKADGRLVDGAGGFIALWLTLPGWRWLGRIASIPPMPWLLERAYRAFLPLRPIMRKWTMRTG